MDRQITLSLEHNCDCWFCQEHLYIGKVSSWKYKQKLSERDFAHQLLISLFCPRTQTLLIVHLGSLNPLHGSKTDHENVIYES